MFSSDAARYVPTIPKKDGKKINLRSSVSSVSSVCHLRTHNSELKKSYHEKGNDKIHYSDLVGNFKRHCNQPGRDLLHQHTVTGNSQ